MWLVTTEFSKMNPQVSIRGWMSLMAQIIYTFKHCLIINIYLQSINWWLPYNASIDFKSCFVKAAHSVFLIGKVVYDPGLTQRKMLNTFVYHNRSSFKVLGWTPEFLYENYRMKLNLTAQDWSGRQFPISYPRRLFVGKFQRTRFSRLYKILSEDVTFRRWRLEAASSIFYCLLPRYIMSEYSG